MRVRVSHEAFAPLPSPKNRSRCFVADPELGLADRFLESAGGGFSVLVFEDEAGIGKTTVRGSSCGVPRSEASRCCPADRLRRRRSSRSRPWPTSSSPSPGRPSPRFRPQSGGRSRSRLLRVGPGPARLDPRTLATAVTLAARELSGERPLLVDRPRRRAGRGRRRLLQRSARARATESRVPFHPGGTDGLRATSLGLVWPARPW